MTITRNIKIAKKFSTSKITQYTVVLLLFHKVGREIEKIKQNSSNSIESKGCMQLHNLIRNYTESDYSQKAALIPPLFCNRSRR